MKRILTSLATLALLSVPANAADKATTSHAASSGKPAAEAAKPAAPAEIAAVTFENKLVDGKKTWLPAVAKVKAGEKIMIKVTNTLGEPHGFEIPGKMTEVIPAHESKMVTLSSIKKGETLEVKCQLHPAHVGAKLQGE